MREIGIAVIGTGFMGRAHALAYTAAGVTFPDLIRPRLAVVADISGPAAQAAAEQFGFRRWTTDWRDAVRDPSVGVVSITTPNGMHHEMALAAIAAGKHVHCEKPLAPTAPLAREMTDAAAAAGVRTQVGFNYLKNPLLKLAREMIEAGELGEITGFRGLHAEDFMADPATPWNWRLGSDSGAGALADLGSHIIGIARFLLGPIDSVFADLETAFRSRPVAPGAAERRSVDVDDIARLLLRFRRGCRGSVEANWIATGRQMQLGFEVHGSAGSLFFSQERLNELQFCRAGDDRRHRGFTRIEAGPQHEPYRRFCVAPGHQLGFNDLKTIEMAEFLDAIQNGSSAGPDFSEGWEVQRLVDAAIRSSREGTWVPTDASR